MVIPMLRVPYQDCATVEPTQLGVRLYTGDKPGGIRFAIFPKEKPSSPGVLQSGEVINDQQWTQLWLYWTENCPAVTSVSNFNEKCMQDSGRTTIMGKTFNWNSDDRGLLLVWCIRTVKFTPAICAIYNCK